MNLWSHAMVANRATKEILPFYARKIVVFASLFPDFNRETQPHRTDNLLVRIFNNQRAMLLSKNKFEKIFRLGILLHYICDYFCYAHNYDLDISHGITHMEYEVNLQKQLKKMFFVNVNREKSNCDLMKYILDSKKKYIISQRDIQTDLIFTLDITEEIIANFKKSMDIT